MTQKADFNAEEWEKVVAGPPIAGMIVVTAESGGTVRESLQLGKAYKEARQAHIGPELINELIDTPPEFDPRGYAGQDDLRTRGLESLREAVGIFAAKADEDELDSYRGFIMGIAERVAHAHKTGGFLGFGGHEVSENERLALEEVREAIGAHPIPDSEEE
jgi:hypothetical protein